MDRQFQARWRQAEAQLRDRHDSSTAQAQQLAASLQHSEVDWNTSCDQQLHITNERRLQLEAQALRRSQDLEQQALSLALLPA